MRVKVETKDWEGEYEVENGFQAIKAFFADVKAKKIGLEQVGAIGFWLRADGERIPFRVFPTLFNMGLINADTYRESSRQLGFDMTDEELFQLALKDGWMGEWKDRTQPDRPKETSS